MPLIDKAVLFALALSLIALLSPWAQASAAERYTVGAVTGSATYRFNNENWFTLPHPKIATFTVNADGSAYGLTETNIPFSQYNIQNPYGIRIQRFEIEDHYHYIVDGRIAYTTEELSAELARAIERTGATS